MIEHLSALRIEAYHDSIIDKGLPGLRAGFSVQTIVDRIETILYYEGVDSFNEIAALYAATIAQSHVFNDGNKRIALCKYSSIY